MVAISLPTEIQELVFSNLNSRDLFEVAVTCKSWRYAAERCLYSNITLDLDGDNSPTSLKYIADKQDSLVKSLSLPDKQFRFWVESITIANDIPYEIFLAAVAQLSPNLVKIDIKYPSTASYHILSQLHAEGYLQKLKAVPSPESIQEPVIRLLLTSPYHSLMQQIKSNIDG